MFYLPPDIYNIIYQFIDIRDIFNLSMVNKDLFDDLEEIKVKKIIEQYGLKNRLLKSLDLMHNPKYNYSAAEETPKFILKYALLVLSGKLYKQKPKLYKGFYNKQFENHFNAIYLYGFMTQFFEMVDCRDIYRQKRNNLCEYTYWDFKSCISNTLFCKKFQKSKRFKIWKKLNTLLYYTPYHEAEEIIKIFTSTFEDDLIFVFMV